MLDVPSKVTGSSEHKQEGLNVGLARIRIQVIDHTLMSQCLFVSFSPLPRNKGNLGVVGSSGGGGGEWWWGRCLVLHLPHSGFWKENKVASCHPKRTFGRKGVS